MENDGKGGGGRIIYTLTDNAEASTVNSRLLWTRTDAAVTPPTEDHGRARAVD